MKKRFSDEQIISILREAEAGVSESRYRGSVQPSLGNRAWVQGDEAASAE